MQFFLQVFQPKKEAKYEYKCNISVKCQLHGKLSFLPLTRTNHQPPFEVLCHLLLHLSPPDSVTAPQNVLRFSAISLH